MRHRIALFFAMLVVFFHRIRTSVVNVWMRARTWYADLTPDGKKKIRLASIMISACALLALCITWGTRKPSDSSADAGVSEATEHVAREPVRLVTSKPEHDARTEYTVRQGDFIVKIAQAKGVPWESLIIANERELNDRASRRCSKLSERYTKDPNRDGHYCNSLLVYHGRHMVSFNSLQPGDTLHIPSTSTPVAVRESIKNIKGNKIVVVIDDTGSMTDDRERVSSWYLQEIKNSGKQIARVILYADGYYRELNEGNVDFRVSGTYENTRGALELASRYHPDAIVLVSDEPGDDWRNFSGLHLPPVIAHSLNNSADENLERVARLTGGSFLTSHAGAIAEN